MFYQHDIPLRFLDVLFVLFEKLLEALQSTGGRTGRKGRRQSSSFCSLTRKASKRFRLPQEERVDHHCGMTSSCLVAYLNIHSQPSPSPPIT